MSESDVNDVHLRGRLGRDPEMRYTTNGQSLTAFSLVTDRMVQQGPREDNSFKAVPTWHNIVFWGRIAEDAAAILYKGAVAEVWGRIDNRSWDNDQGVKQYRTEVVAREFLLASEPRTGPRQAQSAPPGQQARPRPRQPHEPGWDPRHEGTSVGPPPSEAPPVGEPPASGFDGPDPDDLPFE